MSLLCGLIAGGWAINIVPGVDGDAQLGITRGDGVTYWYFADPFKGGLEGAAVRAWAGDPADLKEVAHAA